MPQRLAAAWLAALLLLTAAPAAAQSTITVSNDRASPEFPDRLIFSATFQSDTPIEKVVLEYGVDQLTCGTVIAKAFPEIQPGNNVDAEWIWEMKQSGSLPPGAKVWWRWRITDAQGREIVTNDKETTWLDQQHDWQTISGGNINLHWYDYRPSFGQDLHRSAVQSLENLAQATGLRAGQPIDLYIYADTQDMRDAVLYEPGWTGGQAYAANDIVIIGISPDQIDWGKRTQAHELTHVLVGHLTFTCLGEMPTWLSEGLAVYGEGGPEEINRRQFDQAINDNTLLPVRSLSGGFSEVRDIADLSYTQSYSLVNFLIEKHGQDKMRQLLRALRDGSTLEQALQATYGFDIDGFEAAWRSAIGAPPRSGSAARPTPTLTPTMVPTFAPASISIAGPTPAPTRERPTPTPIEIARANAPVATVTASAVEVTNALPAVIVVIGVVIVATIVAALIVGRRKQRTNE
jgi:hypothetical protein